MPDLGLREWTRWLNLEETKEIFEVKCERDFRFREFTPVVAEPHGGAESDSILLVHSEGESQ